MPRQGPWRLTAAYAPSDRLTPGAESPPIEPAIHSEHNRQDHHPDHALPHPHQGAVSRNRSMRGIAQAWLELTPRVEAIVRAEAVHARLWASRQHPEFALPPMLSKRGQNLA
jgi:hypothetical protein